MIGRVIASHYHLPEDEDTLFLRWKGKPHPQVPSIRVIHDDRPMLKSPGMLEKSKAYYKPNKVIFLVRDPRDVIVSSYFEMSKRGHIFGTNPYEKRQAVYEGSLSAFINQEEGGFDTILAYYNIWADNRHIPQGFHLIRYEDIKENPLHELRKVLDFLGMDEISDQTIREAVEFASFDNMRKMERDGKYQSGILNPADSSDVDSYKTRKGVVKGYLSYLSDAEIETLNKKTQSDLAEIFGYNS
jgi:hypothetical protein